MSNRRKSRRRKWQSGFAFAGIFVLCLVSMAGCDKKNSDKLISSALVEEEAGFGQDTAKNGDFVEKKTFDAKRVYPLSNVITSQRDGVRFPEYYFRVL